MVKRRTGLTFSVYLNRLRIAEAARLLSQKSDANITEIAYAIGFNNTSYFNRLFKKQYGCTPSLYKRFCQSEKTDV